MRMSRLLAPTLREVPAEAEIASHQLLLRAGFIRRVSPGVYNFLPLMRRVLRKVEEIVRQEMDASGAQEISMPILCPAELWQQSGRWSAYGKEMFRVKNRHDRDELLGPTHEEVVTAIAREEIRSYRQLPVNLYQIQSKFRDEIRPRFGLLRGREFIMKDAYSFHEDEASLEETYAIMCRTYTRIFERCGLATRIVESDVGAIGGSAAHEFMVVVETAGGENDILYCNACAYAANTERADSQLSPSAATGEPPRPRQEAPTPGIRTVEEQARMLGIHKDRIVKTVLCVATWNEADGSVRQQPVLALVRGDLDVNLVKLGNVVASHEIRAAAPEEVLALVGVEPGFVGPFSLPASVRVVADESVKALTNFSTGAGRKDMHWIDANWSEDFSPRQWADIRQAQVGQTCSRCGQGQLLATKGIEVGNTFKLGTKYSQAMSAVFDAPDGSEQPFIMGCYGIGITRTAQAAVEACHDENGIQWPLAIAPYHLVIIPANPQDPDVMRVALDLYDQAGPLGVEAVLDDRDERAGVKFKDADLIGFPLRLTVGKALKEGKVEFKVRATGEQRDLPVSEAMDTVAERIGRTSGRAPSLTRAPV